MPGKNIRDFCGKPLIAYTIDAARKASLISRVVVSTDSVDIASVAEAAGAEVPFLRPSELATDDASAVDVYLHAIHQLRHPNGGQYDELVVLLPTCPLRDSSDIDAAIRLYKERGASSVISYTQETHPVRWHTYLTETGQFDPIFPESLANRQQERASYYPNGAVYVLSCQLLARRTYHDSNSFAYVMPRSKSVDIDTLDDFLYAEFLARKS